MNTLGLALRLLRRNWRAGELLTLAAALVIAISAVLTISLISDRLTNGMARESAELIGGDLVINSTRPPDPDWEALGRHLGLNTARISRFDSVLFSGDDMLLSSIKAVSDNYPLLGTAEISTGRDRDPVPAKAIPEPGTAWADPRVLDRLNVEVGDSVEFGATRLRIEAILRYEPDQGNSLFQFAPRLLINEADLAPAKVIGPGSRIRYRTLFQGEDIAALRQSLGEDLGPGHRLVTPTDEGNQASTALVKATQYIRIATLLALVLAAIAIALTARRYSENHYDFSAMLSCLGAQQRDIFTLYLYQLMVLTASAIAVGGAIGWLAHGAILQILKPLLPLTLPPAGLEPWLVAGGCAALLIIGFALPPILRLSGTPPLRVLRRDLSPLPMSTWLVYGTAAVSQGALLWLLFDDLPDILLILLATAVALGLLGAVIYQGLQKLKNLMPPGGGLWRRSLRNIAGHGATSTSQIMAFGLTLMLVITVTQLRSGLLSEWQMQLPEDAPNHFAFNLFPDQVEEFRRILADKATLKPLYPVIRGRLMAINGSARAVEDGGDTNRELNFTWTDTLPADNEILKGEWPPRGRGVSVEIDYAERLGLDIGDSLSIDISGARFDAEVTSLRSVVWESLSPNFYLVFSEDLLADRPTTYLTSFHLNEGERKLLRELVETFPALTLIDIGSIMSRMELILNQVTLSVELVMAFVMLGGFAVLFATLHTTGAQRLQEGALMRSMGATRRYLMSACFTEFGILGIIAGGLAIGGAEIATALIYRNVFDLRYTPTPWLWLAIPLAMGLVVAVAGLMGNRRVIRVSPLRLLQN